jgi:hypothetical protein
MQRLNYWQFPGFENVYLEDSYVLAIKAKASVEILIEAVLTENHPLYTSPLPGEQYCYRQMTIKFFLPQTYNLVLKKMTPIPAPDGSIDYGNIDEFFLDAGKYYINGEWGELTIVSAPPILHDSDYIFVKNGENTIVIYKDKIQSFEWKNEGAIALVYENNSGHISSVQIDREKDWHGFATAVAYMGEMDGDYVTEFTGSEELSFSKIEQSYPKFKDENVKAVAIAFSVSAITK